MPHVLADGSIELGLKYWIRQLCRHELVDILWRPRLICVLQYHQDMCMGEAALLKFDGPREGHSSAHDAIFDEVFHQSLQL